MVDPTTQIPAYEQWHVNTVQVTANPGRGTPLVELVAATLSAAAKDSWAQKTIHPT